MDTYGITRDELKFLVRDRDSDSVSRINEFGGAEGIAKKLGVDSHKGVTFSPGEISKRQKIFGSNFVPPPSPRTYLSFLKDAFGDLTIMILCAAAIVELGISFGYEHTSSSYAESVAILVSIAVVTNVAAANDYRKQSQFRKLNALVDNMAVVALRDGQKKSLFVNDIVVGDVVALSVGDIMCADGLLLEGYGVQMDESSLTGEAKNIKKSVGNPILLSGTKVMEGTGNFVVIAVGENSESGQIRMIVQGKHVTDDEKQPDEERSVLTNKLNVLATSIGKAGSAVALFCFIVMVVRFSVVHYALSDPMGECAIIANSLCGDESVQNLSSGGAWPVCGFSSPTCCEDTSLGAIIRGRPCPWLKVHLSEYIGFFITAITILVVAVPEGLPLAVTLALAFSVIQMQVDHNLVKHLDACETMGSATTICSDKTGTLTKNRMTVMRAFVGGASFRPAGTMPVGVAILGYSEGEYTKFLHDTSGKRLLPNAPPHAQLVCAQVCEIISEGVSVNSSGDIKWDSATRLWEQLGNKTECALLQFVEDLGFEYTEIRSRAKPYLEVSFPFNSAKKRSSCVLRLPGGSFRVHVKGASEMVLSLCTSMVDPSGEIVPLTPDRRASVDSKISEFASLAMRTICIAYRDYPEDANWEEEVVEPGQAAVCYKCEQGLVLLGIVGMEDPLRDEVPAAILSCRSAGIDVRMVTGDNLDTAVAIAKGCGILRPTDLLLDGTPKLNCAMTGPDFRKRVLTNDGKINREEFDAVWPFLRVLARSSPQDKFTLVSGLCESELYKTFEGQSLGVYSDRQVVAVTGDGTNDGPALKRADVGFAMGITGTAVAKEAADIILMDDNFSSIVKACMWGRNVHEGIAKFLQFQLTVNIVALVLAIEGSLCYSESPLKAVQMLWVNLIMDSLASLALATETPTAEQLQRPPIGRNQSMISTVMAWNILGHAAYQLTVLNVIFFAGPEIFGFDSGSGQSPTAAPTEHYTLIFNTFVLIQLFNQINSRKLHHEWALFRGLLRGKLFMAIIVGELAVQVIVIEFGGNWFRTTHLSLVSWLVGFGLAICVFPVQWLIVWAAAIVRRCASTDKKVHCIDSDETGSSSIIEITQSAKSIKIDGTVAYNPTKTKRNESSKTMAKALTKQGDDQARKRMAKIGAEYQQKRRSINETK